MLKLNDIPVKDFLYCSLHVIDTTKQECIQVGCVPSGAVAVSRGGGYLPGGCTWSRGGVHGLRGVPARGYLVWGVYLVGGVPTWAGVPGLGGVAAPGGCTWSRGVYLVLGGVPGQVLPPVDRHTPVKT